ncbi:MAG TPA: DivIVA domain-containing protein [Propionibacteriaceae bacterium]|nr:DivIVA domain-containing protein [Propionibacteriaceae bacterium]
MNPAFRTVMRGYEPNEVDKALADLRKALESARSETATYGVAVSKLQAQVAALEEGLATERQRSALLASEQAQQAEPTFADFGARIGKILTLANDEAKDLVSKAKAEATVLTRESTTAADQMRTAADRYAADTRSKADADAAKIVESARQQADEILDSADREATARREEAEAVYEHQRARAAAAAADFEKTLADRRAKSAAEFSAAMQAHEEAMNAARERQAASDAEAERTLSAARAQAEAHLKAAQEEAAQHLSTAKANADKVRRESERELQAATSRRDAITAQLTNVRQMLATLGGSSIGNPFGEPEPETVAEYAHTEPAAVVDDEEELEEEYEDSEDSDEEYEDEDEADVESDEDSDEELDESELTDGEKAHA